MYGGFFYGQAFTGGLAPGAAAVFVPTPLERTVIVAAVDRAVVVAAVDRIVIVDAATREED